MKPILICFVGLFACSLQTWAQGAQPTVTKIYENAEKLFIEKSYSSAIDYLNKNAGKAVYTNDSLLYLKIKILNKLYDNNFSYTQDLDSSLKIFMRKVNRYSFPEIKYSEVAAINSSLLAFKEKDKNFNDSVNMVVEDAKKNLLKVEGIEPLKLINSRVAAYLKATPNSYYARELNAQSSWLSGEIAQLEKQKSKIINDSVNHKILKDFGKGSVISFSYLTPIGSTNTPHSTLSDENEVYNFLNGGSFTKELGIKYGLGASLVDLSFNLYTGTRIKASINWTLFDAEYTVLDWDTDSLLNDKSEIKSLKAGTRVGPAITFLLTRKIAICAYYNVRPSTLFLMGNYKFTTYHGTLKEYSIEPEYWNLNWSHEVGAKFIFFKHLYLNPFFHFGTFNWKSNFTYKNSTTETKQLEASHDFNFAGIRIGI